MSQSPWGAGGPPPAGPGQQFGPAQINVSPPFGAPAGPASAAGPYAVEQPAAPTYGPPAAAPAPPPGYAPYGYPPPGYGPVPGGWAAYPGAPVDGQIPVGWMVVGLLFRAAIAALAWWSLLSIVWGIPQEYLLDALSQFSLLQVLIAGVVTTLAVFRPVLPAPTRQRRFEGSVGWARGMTTLYSLCTLLVFGFMMEGFGDSRVNWNVLHFLVPTLLLLDFLLFGQNQERIPWWMPLVWLVPMFAYLGWAIVLAGQDRPIYYFLDPDNPDFLTWIAILFGGWLVLGYVLVGLGRLRGAIRRSGQVAQ